jgi:hypothetical protein
MSIKIVGGKFVSGSDGEIRKFAEKNAEPRPGSNADTKLTAIPKELEPGYVRWYVQEGTNGPLRGGPFPSKERAEREIAIIKSGGHKL